MKLASLDNVKSFINSLPEFELKPISINGKEIAKYRAVCYKNSNNVVAIVTNKYKLVQHKTVFEIVLERIAKYYKEEFIKGWVEHTKTKAYLFITFRHVIITNDSYYYTGLLVTNSVNTELSIWTNLFTYREVCSNGLIQKNPLLQIQNKHISGIDFWNRFKERIDTILKNFDKHIDNELHFLNKLKEITIDTSEILKHIEMSRKAKVFILKQLKSKDTLFNIYQAITNYYSNTNSMNIASRVNYTRKAREIIEKYVEKQ